MKAIIILLLFIGGISCCGQQLDEEFYKNLLDKEFTKVLTGQNTNFGTFAGIGIKEDIASFAGNLQIGKSSCMNINVKGGATEGLIPILNGEKVSSNIAVNAQLNFGMYRNLINPVISDATANINYTTYLVNLQNETNKQIQDLDLLEEKTDLELSQKEEKIVNLEKKISSMITEGSQREKIKRDSLALQIKILKNEINFIKVKKSEITTQNIAAQKQALRERMVAFKKEAESKLSLSAFKLKWFSVFANLRNRSFNQFDASYNYDEQLTKINNNRLELGFAYNIYNLKNENFRSYFMSVGLSYSVDDNFDDLVKKTLTEKSDIAGTASNRNLSETKTVYLGPYQKNISNIKVNSNLYWFPTYNQIVAFHIQPALRYNFKDNVKLDSTIGLMVGFKNTEKDKSILNVELFYNMKDIFKNSSDKDDQLTDRSALGINLNFPITFKTL